MLLLQSASISSFAAHMRHEMSDRTQHHKLLTVLRKDMLDCSAGAGGTSGDSSTRQQEQQPGRGYKKRGAPSLASVKVLAAISKADAAASVRQGDPLSQSVLSVDSTAQKRQKVAATPDTTPVAPADSGVRSKGICLYFGRPGKTCHKGDSCKYLHEGVEKQ
jgi:hypothetical protein